MNHGWGRRPRPPVARWLVLSAAVGTALAAASWAHADDAQLARQLEAARQLEREGQLEQARALYQQTFDQAPVGPLADDALLALAHFGWPVEAPDELGTVPRDSKALEAARTDLELIVTKLPSSDGAPEALWRLALLALEPSAPWWNPEDARARLTTLITVNPNSARVPDARALSARILRESGKLDRAANVAFELLAASPRHARAARAWQILGEVDALRGQLGPAVVEFSHALEAAGTDDRAKRLAEDWLALAERFAFLDERDGQLGLAPDEKTKVPLALRCAALAVDDAGTLFAALPREGQVVALRANGTAERWQLPGVRSVSLDAWGRQWAVGDQGLVLPVGVSGIRLPEKAEPQSVAAVGPRSAWIGDAKTDGLLRVDAGGSATPARFAGRVDIRHLVANEDGGAWVLDSRNDTVAKVGADGALQLSLKLENVAGKPVDIARDALGQIYVLDAKAPAVVIFAATGQQRARIELPREGPGAFPRPMALAVDRGGRIAIYDEKRGNVTWLR